MGMGEGKSQHWQLAGEEDSSIACTSARHRGEVMRHAFHQKELFFARFCVPARGVYQHCYPDSPLPCR